MSLIYDWRLSWKIALSTFNALLNPCFRGWMMIMANITQYQVTNITQLCANCWKYETQTTAQLQLSLQNNAGSCLFCKRNSLHYVAIHLSWYFKSLQKYRPSFCSILIQIWVVKNCIDIEWKILASHICQKRDIVYNKKNMLLAINIVKIELEIFKYLPNICQILSDSKPLEASF